MSKPLFECKDEYDDILRAVECHGEIDFQVIAAACGIVANSVIVDKDAAYRLWLALGEWLATQAKAGFDTAANVDTRPEMSVEVSRFLQYVEVGRREFPGELTPTVFALEAVIRTVYKP